MIFNLHVYVCYTAVVDSVSRYEDAKDEVDVSDEDTPSYSTPTASREDREQSMRALSPLSMLPTSSSTPAVKVKSPASVHFSPNEVVYPTHYSNILLMLLLQESFYLQIKRSLQSIEVFEAHLKFLHF